MVSKERFVYDTNIKNPNFSEVVQVLDEANNFAVKHRFLNGPELDQVFGDQTADGSIFWLLQDNQQTVTDVAKFGDLNSDGGADTKAKIVDHLTYNAFGKVINADNPQITNSTTDGLMPGLSTAGSPQQSYTGQLFDSATGLHYYDARWFDPFTNQFVSEDPLGFAAGDTNLRRYVGNSNPNGTDPSGLQVKIDRSKLQSAKTALLLRERAESIEINSLMGESILKNFENRPDVVGIWYDGDKAPVPGEFLPPKVRVPLVMVFGIRDGNDSITDIAFAYNSLGVKENHCFQIDPKSPDTGIESSILRIQALPPEEKFELIIFTGHGNSGKFSDSGGVSFDLTMLKDSTSPQYRLLIELEKRRVTRRRTVIDLRLFEVADRKRGEDFLAEFAKVSQSKVIGYTQIHGGVPHGTAKMAYPDGRVITLREYPEWKGNSRVPWDVLTEGLPRDANTKREAGIHPE